MNEELQAFQSQLRAKFVSNIKWHLHNIAQDVTYNSTTSVEQGFRCLQGAITTIAAVFNSLQISNKKVVAELLNKEKIGFQESVGNIEEGLIKESVDASIDEINGLIKALKNPKADIE